MFLIQPHRGPTTPVHTAQPHVPSHCGQISCAHHVLISAFPWGPPHSKQQQSSEQDTENHSNCIATGNTPKGTLKIPPLFLPGRSAWCPLIGQWVLALLRLKCASYPGPHLLKISGVVCIPLTFEIRYQEASHPTQPWGRNNIPA